MRKLLERFDRPVRCRRGHLFTTIWIPWVSVKAVRLGPRRFQHCPVGHHWTTVARLEPTDEPAAFEQARTVHDVHIP